jgi:hypothetical protein
MADILRIVSVEDPRAYLMIGITVQEARSGKPLGPDLNN